MSKDMEDNKIVQEILVRDFDKLRCFDDDPKIYIWVEDVIPLILEYADQLKSEWISISTRLPEDKTSVLIFNGQGKVLPAYFNDGRFERYFDKIERGAGMIDRIQVVYYTSIIKWKPLPAPPIS